MYLSYVSDGKALDASSTTFSEIKYSIRLYMETKDAGPEEDGYDPSMLCNFCLLNQQKDVKRCRMLSASAGTPDAFVKAMHENVIEMMRGLVNHGFDKDSIYGSKVKNTMLCIAAMNGHAEAFDFLLDLDANATTLNSAGVGCLHYACARGHVCILEKLYSNGAKVDLSLKDKWHGSTPAMWGAERGRVKVLKFIFDKFGKEYLIEHDSYRRTCSHYAALRGSIETLRFLHKVKCLQYDFEDNEGRTPYALAKAYGHAETVKLLTNTCPHPYLEEDSICAVCGMDKYDFEINASTSNEV